MKKNNNIKINHNTKVGKVKPSASKNFTRNYKCGGKIKK